MKRLFFLIGLFFIGFSSFAQLQGTLETTGAYSFNLDTPGVNVRGYVFLTEKLHLGLEYTHLFDKTDHVGEEKIETSANVFDLNTNYFFELTPHLAFYSIVGLDYSRETEHVALSDEQETLKDDALGYNLGGGFEVPVSEHFAVIAEYTHTFSDLHDNIAFLGVVYEWGTHKKHGEHSKSE